MKLLVLAVGHRQPAWVAEGCGEYVKRMPREAAVEVIEIKPEPRAGGKTREQLMAAERGRIEAALPAGVRVVALDERGEDLTTVGLTRHLEGWLRDGRDTALLIGGADGLDPALKSRAEQCIRLSSMTLPHGLARVLLCEQLYRAVSVLKGHPYHRA